MRALAVALALLAAAAQPATRWEQWQPLPGVVDVVGPRADGKLVAASAGRLVLVDPAGGITPFAPDYLTPPGPEPYLAMSPGLDLPEAGCRFERDDVYALELSTPARVIRIDRAGAVSTFAEPPGVEFLSGINFDTVGRFGRRLLVTGKRQNRNVLLAIDCRARVATIADNAPVVEGGIEVAPNSFGRFAGALIAPDELSGDLVAFRPDGTTEIVARPDLPAGGDIGVESVGFVPPGFFPNGTVYVADRRSPGAPTEGTDTILRLTGAALSAAGVREGDLIVVAESAGRTVFVRCATNCTATRIADATPAAHAEGHVTFVLSPPAPTTTTVAPVETDDPPYTAIALVSAALGVLLLVVVAVAHRRRHPNLSR